MAVNPLRKMVLGNQGPAKKPLVARIEQQMAINARAGMRPDDGLWHPSVISECICPRKAVIEHVHPARIPARTPPDPHLQLIFQEGHIRHRYWQNNIFGPMGILWGRWRNPLNRNEIVTGFQPPAVVIMGYAVADGTVMAEEVGEILPWEYVECPMYHKGLRLGGHTDGVLALRNPTGSYTLALLELKSCNSMVFTKLLGPLEKHERQLECYGNMNVNMPEAIEQLGTDVVSQAFFVYINKDNSDYKTYDYQFNRAIFEEVSGPVRQANTAIEAKKLPTKLTECLRTNSSRAASCWCRRECFTVGSGSEGFVELQNVSANLPAPTVVDDDAW